MTVLLTAHSISKAYGSKALFQGISFTLNEGDRIGLIGPNGAGKSTLLKILIGDENANDGQITMRQGLRIGYASQSPEFPSKSVEEAVIEGISGREPHELHTRARILLGKAQFTDFEQDASTLSGGWKKRLDIVRALMHEPDFLLLDEPTNHLDLEGILWLEGFLKREKISFLVISHDRYFLENLATKIFELNPCYPDGIFISEGNMSSYMELKEAFLEGQLKLEKGLRSNVKAETEWLRRSPKARTTKSQSRVQNAYKITAQLADVKKRNLNKTVGIHFSSTKRETRKLLSGNNLAKSLGGKKLFQGVDITLSPGSRIGIVGKNGTGKTTLLKIIAGMIEQDMGTLKSADDLKIVYFDQHREQLSPETTLKDALCPSGETIMYQGNPIHVSGWAKKFLFESDRLSLPIKFLSGGERARILIAKLMLEPADILLLDEPTNDLDIPTLEVLEEGLMNFPGAVVLISHDRCLMDRVCTSILGLGTNTEHEIFADYSQWEEASRKEPPKKVKEAPIQRTKPTKKGLSYKEKFELETMEDNILKTEEKLSSIQKTLEDPKIQADHAKLQEAYEKLATTQKQLDTLFERWDYLSKLQT